MSSFVLTKYEVARALGTRCLQLQDFDARRRSIEELLAGESEIIVRRRLPDQRVVDIPVSQATMPEHLRSQLLYTLEHLPS